MPRFLPAFFRLERIVNDMRSKGADGSEEDFAKVIAYLTKNMGKPQ